MGFKEALSRLRESSEFKSFKSKHKDAYLCAGFFIKDYESGNDVVQLDFQCYKDIATFNIGDKISVKIEKPMKDEKVLEIKENVKIDVEDVESTAKKELENQKMGKNIKKIIAILQMHEKRLMWNVTNILDTFAILSIHIDAVNGKVLKSEKANLFDFFKKPADYVG